MRRNSLMFICLLLVCVLVFAAKGRPYRRRRGFRKSLNKCVGTARRMCYRLSSYCHPRILKRSLDNEDTLQSANRAKRHTVTRHFRFNCGICKAFCWK